MPPQRIHSRPEPSYPKNGEVHKGDHGKSSDSELWNAFRKGDEGAFIQIYNHYANILFNYGCQYTADREMVKDCLHDFFIYLRKNRAGFSQTSSIKMYLLKAFRRRLVDYLKKQQKEFQQNETFLFFQFPVELSSETVYINRQIEENQLKQLNRALKTLDSKEREAIFYFYYEGLGYEEIASILNFSHISSARRLIYRALGRLRKIMMASYLTVCLTFLELLS